MHIKEDLVYNRTTGELTGFCQLHVGDINDHLLKLEKQYMEDDKMNSEKLATTVLVLMVKGLFNNLAFPYATFPSTNLTGDQLMPIFYEAIMRVERCDLQVVGITLDGNSANRKFFKLIGTSLCNGILHTTHNPLGMNERKLFL